MKLVPPPPSRLNEQSGTNFVAPQPGSAGRTDQNHGVRDSIVAESGTIEWDEQPRVARGGVDQLPATGLRTATVYDAYATFVWRSLQRMGVPLSDLEDALQEVFIVVHRKLAQYDAERAKLSTWLFGISLNVARKHRGRSRLTFGHDVDAQPGLSGNQESLLQSRQQVERLGLLLSKMKPEHSATFVMFELEALTCQEIADLTGVPVGTVYSRLHKAREQFKELAEKAEKGPSRVMRLAHDLLGSKGVTP